MSMTDSNIHAIPRKEFTHHTYKINTLLNNSYSIELIFNNINEGLNNYLKLN